MAPSPRPKPRSTLASLIAVALVVAGLLWVAHAFVAHNQLQNCVDSGRRDCFPGP